MKVAIVILFLVHQSWKAKKERQKKVKVYKSERGVRLVAPASAGERGKSGRRRSTEPQFEIVISVVIIGGGLRR